MFFFANISNLPQPISKFEDNKPEFAEGNNFDKALDSTESPLGDEPPYTRSYTSEPRNLAFVGPVPLHFFDNQPCNDDLLGNESMNSEFVVDFNKKNVVWSKNEPILHFHPTLPQIVYSYGSGTYLWNFCSLLHSTIHEVYREHIQIHNSALSNIRIADSGNLLYGFESVGDKERVVILNLGSYQRVFGKQSIVPAQSQILDSTKSVVQHLKHFSRADLVREASSQAQTSGTAMLVLNPSGIPALSILRQSKDDGSLVQETFDTEGNTSAREILHLPSSISHDTDVTLLSPGESGSQHRSKRVKVLLGVRPKSSYSLKEASTVKMVEESLPVIFQRDKSSITTVQGQIQHSTKGGFTPRSLDFSTPEQSNSSQGATKRKSTSIL